MRVIHLADLHFRRDRFDEAAASINAVVADIEEHGADLIAIAGDTWDGPVQNTAGARFADFLGLVRELADHAPVAMIYGTPSHDTDGSLEVFEEIRDNFGVTIVRPGVPYFLGGDAITEGAAWVEEPRALLFGVPEPNKKWLLANAGATGKDDSDLAVRDAMRALLLGLGGIRRQHPDLPCVLLYHGQVSGARTGTGYQAGSGIMVSRDDLAQVDADYYALGDIHEPQQIPGLPAYYPGSIYPLTWGETHQAGCNVVTIVNDDEPDQRTIMMDRIVFPHPQRVKIARRWPDDDPLYAEIYEGNLTWLEVTASREDAQGLDADKILANLLEEGALPGSRVTLNVLPTETVRAGEITSKRTLADKLRVWGENSSTEIPEGVIAKATDLEREIVAAGAGGQGAHIRIDRLILRGAIGIWKKSKKDEIDLDLEALGPGVLALVGPNGAGKTTIIENLHPWPCMLTRDGTLKDHFRLRDSCRDLYFTDLRNGVRYRALISIRADIASGATEYFIYRDLGAGYEPLPGINGRKEPYEAGIAELFGTLEMYLRTAFVTQRPSKLAPDLGEATKGERRALFSELAGINYLDRYRVAAKAQGDDLEASLLRLDATIAAGSGLKEQIRLAKLDAYTEDGLAERATAEAEASAARGQTLKAERETLAARVSELDRKAARRVEVEREIASLLADVKTAEESIALFQSAAGRRGEAAEELAQITALRTEEAGLKEARSGVERANHSALAAYQAAQTASTIKHRKAQAELDLRKAGRNAALRSLDVARARLAEPIVDTCPTCGQTLPEDKIVSLRLAQERLSTEVVQLEHVYKTALKAEELAQASLDAIQPPVPPTAEPLPHEARLHEIDRILEWSDEDAARETIRRADEASIRIEGARDKIEAAQARIAADTITAAKLWNETEGREQARQELADLDAELETERERYTAAKSAAASARATAEAARRHAAEAETRLAARRVAEGEAGAARVELADWRLLERATGPNGIQALELDAIAPSIAEVANRLLGETYGGRYLIEFRTTRLAGKGSKIKQVEDFEIFVLDTETGDEQEIATLSGGEAVWIRKALYDSFGIVRARNVGTQFLTVFLDEADGALDPEARMLYLRMLEAAHREARRHQTILISHSTEIQAMVAQTIDVARLTARAAQEVTA